MQISLTNPPERMGPVLPTMRHSMLMILTAFVFFGIAYLFLLRIIDPLPPFMAVASEHADIHFAYIALNWSAYLAFLAIVLGGLPILFAALKHAYTHGGLLAIFAVRPKQILLLLGLTLALDSGFFGLLFVAQIIFSRQVLSAPPIGLPPLAIVTQLAVLALFTFILLASIAVIARIILRSEFRPNLLRYAYIPMAIVTLAMGLSLLATIAWTMLLWTDVPQFAASQGLDPAGIRGNIGGSEGVVIVVVMMLVALGVAIVALQRALRARDS